MWPLSRKKAAASPPEEHAIIVTTGPGIVTPEQVFAVEDDLEAALASGEFGFLDGHEIAVSGSGAIFYIYGPDADALFAEVVPVLRRHSVTEDGTATLRYGSAENPNSKEQRIKISRPV